MWMEKPRKPLYKRWWFWVIGSPVFLFIILVIIALSTSGSTTDDSSTHQHSHSSNPPKQTAVQNKPKKEQPPKPSWPQMAVTKDNVIAALKTVSFGKAVDVNAQTLIGAKVTTDANGQKDVEITVDPGTVWNETDYVERMAETITAYAEKLFQNPRVGYVSLKGVTTFTDQYGNESRDTAVQIDWSRSTAAKINWSNFENMVTDDYKHALVIADYYYIHPGIYKNLNRKDGIFVEGGAMLR